MRGWQVAGWERLPLGIRWSACGGDRAPRPARLRGSTPPSASRPCPWPRRPRVVYSTWYVTC
eukprot:1393485-Prymnesium_polylepis.2